MKEGNIDKPELKKRWSRKKWLAFLLLLLVLVLAIPVVNELVPQRVNVKYVAFDGEHVESYWTRAHRVSEFVGEHSDKIGAADVVTGLVGERAFKASITSPVKRLFNIIVHGIDKETREYDDMDGINLVNEDIRAGSGPDAYVSNDMTLRVLCASSAEAKIGGRKEQINLYPGDVSDTLEYNKIDIDTDDLISPALDAELDFDDTIRITRVDIVKKNKTLEIQPEEKGAVFDKSLASGTIVRTEGKPGKAVYTYTYKYRNGKKIKTSKKFRKWVKKPVDIRLTFGTSETGETGAANYSETFIGNCTAYYAGNNAHGATGQRCYYGTCAVDPSVIPYGTKLYVEGYGTAIANDCGGAVKGHIIDLYMKSTKACFSWGRRNKKVYVLK